MAATNHITKTVVKPVGASFQVTCEGVVGAFVLKVDFSLEKQCHLEFWILFICGQHLSEIQNVSDDKS